jgi:RecB family exonuclease
MKSELIHQLHEAIQQNPFQRKIVLTRSFAEGRQLLERVCRRYGQVLNVEVQTVPSLAAERSGAALFREGAQSVNHHKTFWIVQGIMQQLASRPDTYIPESMLTPGIVSQVHRAVVDLRNAMVAAKDLVSEHLVNDVKGKYVKELLSLYETALEERKWVDFAGLYHYIAPSAEEAAFIVIDNMAWSRAEELVIEKIAGDRLIRVKAEPAFHDPESQFPSREAEMFHATGSLAEVREVLRRVLLAGIPFDQVEVIASDYELYAGTIHTLADAYQIPCTFSRGLPIEYTKMGQAALNALKWLEGGFPVDLVVGMLRENEIAFRRKPEQGAPGDWIRELERSGIGWGKERYLQLLDPVHVEEERQERVQLLRETFEGVFGALPADGEWTPKAVFRWLVGFLTEFSVCKSEHDASVLQAIKDQAENLEDSLVVVAPHDGDQTASPMSAELAVQYTRNLLQGLRAHVHAMPAPGSMHVTSLSDGGWSGRRRTFMVGMDERAWSASSRQDPVLLDQERRLISPYLQTASESARQLRRGRESRLGMIRGHVTLSYCSYKIEEKQTQSAAYELLQIFRNQSGQPSADFTSLEQHLGTPKGYMVIDGGGIGAGSGAGTGIATESGSEMEKCTRKQTGTQMKKGTRTETGTGTHRYLEMSESTVQHPKVPATTIFPPSEMSESTVQHPKVPATTIFPPSAMPESMVQHPKVPTTTMHTSSEMSESTVQHPKQPATTMHTPSEMSESTVQHPKVPTTTMHTSSEMSESTVQHPKAPCTALLDTTDLWAEALRDPQQGRLLDGRDALAASYATLAAGQKAAASRDLLITEYDGYIRSDAWDTHWSGDTRPYISASQLERYAECPMRYYFHYVLGLRPKDTAEFDSTKWLQANERGQLLHRIFQLYMKEAAVDPSNVRHDRALLVEITDRVIAEYVQRIPCPSPHILEKECSEIRADVEVFYRKEAQSKHKPLFFEQELTLDGEPLRVELSDGFSIVLKGFMDRIDEVAPHQYRIIDYKTGRASKYKQNEYFVGGTQLQHALYAVAAEQWLRLTGKDTHARVVESVYYFPTERGRGQQVIRLQDRRHELADAVRNMLAAMEQGLFVPTKDPRTCVWCDYREGCGRHAEQMQEKREWPDNVDVLRVLMEVEKLV